MRFFFQVGGGVFCMGPGGGGRIDAKGKGEGGEGVMRRDGVVLSSPRLLYDGCGSLRTSE